MPDLLQNTLGMMTAGTVRPTRFVLPGLRFHDGQYRFDAACAAALGGDTAP